MILYAFGMILYAFGMLLYAFGIFVIFDLIIIDGKLFICVDIAFQQHSLAQSPFDRMRWFWLLIATARVPDVMWPHLISFSSSWIPLYIQAFVFCFLSYRNDNNTDTLQYFMVV